MAFLVAKITCRKTTIHGRLINMLIQFFFSTQLKPKPLLLRLLFCPLNKKSKSSLPWVKLAKVEVKFSTCFLRASFLFFKSFK